MRLHDLKPRPGAKHRKKRLGQGESSGRGKTSGRGGKGQSARSGSSNRIGFEGGQMPLHMRLPKLRGFKNPERVEYQAVNVATLNALFPKGGTIGVSEIVAAGAARKGLPIKILGNGEISVALTITAHAFSTSAQEKITAAGGKVNSL